MSLRDLTPVAGISMLYAQSGSVLVTQTWGTSTGHAGGFSGAGTQDYIELLCGSECGEHTAANNTTGTMFFPDIKYFIAIKNYSVTGSAILAAECMAQSISGDNLSKDNSYDPVVSPSVHFRIYHGDEVLGRFIKFAIFKLGAGADRGRILLTKGPSIN